MIKQTELEANPELSDIPAVLCSQRLINEEQEALSSRVEMYAIMADIYRYPDPETRQYVRCGDFKRNLLRIAGKLPYAFPLSDRETSELTYPPDLMDEAIEIEYIRLFEAGPGNPPCPLVEGIHLSKENGRKSIFKDLILFYNHFGLSYAEGSSDDRPDHLVYELEFLHYLAFLELTAMQKGRDAGPLRMAQKDFLERHPLRWTGVIASRMQAIEAGLREGVDKNVVAFYRNVTVLTDRLVKCDFDHLEQLTAL